MFQWLGSSCGKRRHGGAALAGLLDVARFLELALRPRDCVTLCLPVSGEAMGMEAVKKNANMTPILPVELVFS